MTTKRKARRERLQGVLGLYAAGMTHQSIAHFVGVSTRQRAQQLVVEAVATFPDVAARLGVTGRRHPGRRRKEDHEDEKRRVNTTRKPRTPHASVLARHLTTARQLLNQHGGSYPGATEMLRAGHGALYQFMRKYPDVFERLIHERPPGAERIRRKRKRKIRL